MNTIRKDIYDVVSTHIPAAIYLKALNKATKEHSEDEDEERLDELRGTYSRMVSAMDDLIDAANTHSSKVQEIINTPQQEHDTH